MADHLNPAPTAPIRNLGRLRASSAYGEATIRVAFVSTSPPRHCGIATFTHDLISAIRAADPSVLAQVAAIDEPSVVRPYGDEVRWRIRQGDAASYRAAAAAINESRVEVVNVQHEFGLYGTWRSENGQDVYTDHLGEFLSVLRKPVVTTLHSVPPDPPEAMRRAVCRIAELSDRLVVMAHAAVGLLDVDYQIPSVPEVIPHGMPGVEPHGRLRFKEKLDLEGRTIISTFGLVDPRKGLEYAVRAMPEVIAANPEALYLIAGQTHPDLVRTQGERYRNGLLELVEELGLVGHVSFWDHYMSQDEIVELLLATDVYVTPYLDPRQITSGTLAFALGAGKAVVSTPYLHAVEALAEGRGVLVGFRDATAIGVAVNRIIANPGLKQGLETAAYEYARDMTWPKLGAHWTALLGELAALPSRLQEAAAGPDQLGARLPANPILTAEDVKPSLPEFEVVSVFNAAAARVGDETVLLLRVAERPRELAEAGEGALMLDLAAPEAALRPLPAGTPGGDLVGIAMLDMQLDPPRVVAAYVPRGFPGLDLSDPRTIRLHSPDGGSGAAHDIRDYLSQISHLRVARSHDGIHFKVEDEPAVVACDAFEEYGCEDPRATLIEGVWHITYVSVGRIGITTSRLTTTDFRSFDRKGVMFLPDHKDVAIFPERVGGRYVALTRPMPASFGRVLGIWIAYSDDLVNWGGHRPLALPRWNRWDEVRTGASAVPFRVAEGWLELYHGVDRNSRYAMGALLMDSEDPSRVIGRSARPILEPATVYERSGFFNETVFSCGHVSLGGDGERIRLYYGAADTCLAAADFSVREIIAGLTPC